MSLTISEFPDDKDVKPEEKKPGETKTAQSSPLAVRPTMPAKNVIIYPSRKPNGIIHTGDDRRDGFTIEKLAYGLSLPFNPRLTFASDHLDKFEDLQVDKLRNRFAGLVLGVDGTLVAHHSEEFSPQVIDKLKEIKAKIGKVCVFSNSTQYRPIFDQLGIPVVKHAAPKPETYGFVRAAEHYLHLDTQQCAMVGDNYLTDGGARQVGMRYIHVNPIEGSEATLHKMARNYGNWVHNLHERFFRTKKVPQLPKEIKK